MPYPRDSRAIVTRPINLASSRGRDCSCLVRFSTTFLCRLWTDLSMGAEVGRFERYVFLFLALFCSVFWDSNFLEFLKLIDSC